LFSVTPWKKLPSRLKKS